MDKPERELQRDIQLALAEVKGLRLWRANVGKGWVGVKAGSRIEEGRTYLTLVDPRPLDTGLPEGFPDLFGFIQTVQIVHGSFNGVPTSGVYECPPIPVFIEVKSPTGVIRPKQKQFIEAARVAGCRAGIARSVEDALRIVRGEM
jgi:hypothetical protein